MHAARREPTARRQLVERGALLGGEGAEEFVLDSPEPYLSRRRPRAHGTARGRTPGRWSS
ncbi:hypothetical protein [Streptomyces sp. NPDC088261]|uniref:hypothetical protein n=1 Tax=Streptomyces sp. NPDC088261 TaxID=3365851 RepID=UPI0038169A3C